MNVAYLDTSALVKLVVREQETEALRRWLREHEGFGPTELATSTLAGVELRRASLRHSPSTLQRADDVLAGVAQIAMTPDLLKEAGVLEPRGLRSLDAIHLATALRVGRSLISVVAYDERLAAAAEASGLHVEQPR